MVVERLEVEEFLERGGEFLLAREAEHNLILGLALDRRLAEAHGGVMLWEDALPERTEPVSLAAFGGATPNGIRIGPVYTPPDRRGRGYASALTAELTASLLAGGRRFCFLFTNLANPTSNSIYQQVGYRPVTDVDQWLFD